MSDDMPRYSHGMRKAFADKSQNYSPSTSYNYNPAGGMHGGGGRREDQHQRRRPDRFKREPGGLDRLAKQNEQIIKLLREIRDRLAAVSGEPLSGVPAPAPAQELPAAPSFPDQGFDDADVSLDEDEEGL